MIYYLVPIFSVLLIVFYYVNRVRITTTRNHNVFLLEKIVVALYIICLVSIILYFIRKQDIFLYIIGNAVLSFVIMKWIDGYFFRRHYRKEEREFERKLSTLDKGELQNLFEEYGNSRYTDDYVHQAQVAARLSAIEEHFHLKVEYFLTSTYKLKLAWIDTFQKPSPDKMIKQVKKMVHLRSTDGIPGEVVENDTIQIVYEALTGEISISEIKDPDALSLLRKMKQL